MQREARGKVGPQETVRQEPIGGQQSGKGRKIYWFILHAHLSVVDQVLQWVVTGEQVHHLLVIGDGACAGVLGADHA